jgi:tetratricopeptide (TPR) repeat protein
MPDDQVLPPWAIRLREERTRRLWSQKITAVRLRAAADEETRAFLPAVDSIRRYIRDYEAGKHFPGDLYANLYCRAFGLTRDVLFGASSGTPNEGTGLDDLFTENQARSLTAWIRVTNISDEAIEQLAQEASLLAEAHTQKPPTLLLGGVVKTHRRIQGILRSGKQRLRQTRELYRIDTDVLSHASLLLGDLHSDDTAAALGLTSMLYAAEAGANQAIAFSVLAKTERWRQNFAESADLARQGFECSPPTSIRILLASQEANAAALLGDIRRAHEALRRAEDARSDPIAPDSGVSAWSFPRARQALFAMAVAIRSGDSNGALRSAEAADSAWASGDPWVAGTWAQVRLGACIAHIMRDDLDGALRDFAPVQSLAPEFRMATITGYTAQIDKRLHQRRFQRNAIATRIKEKIRDFESAALPALTISEDN